MNSKEIKVSVIIPVYNVEKYIEKCLESVVNQTYKNIEIIVVNDGSTDKSEEKILPYLGKYKNIKYLEKVNGGLSSARNYGILNSIGEYLLFVDSDDWIEVDMVEMLYKKSQEKKSDFVICGVKNIFINGEIKENYTPKSIDLKNILYKSYAWNKLIKKSLFTENDIFFPEGEWYEDVGTIPFLYLKSINPTFIDRDFYNYFQREGSITKQKSNKKSLDILKQYIKIKKYLLEENLMEKYSKDFEWASNYVKRLYLNGLSATSETFIYETYAETFSLLEEITVVNKKDYFLFLFKYIKNKLKNIIKNIIRK